METNNSNNELITAMSPTTKVAVYGTLRKGQGNSSLLGGAMGLGKVQLQGYEMYTAGGFPVCYRTADKRETIVAELYDVHSIETLQRLDGLEGHPDWYRREVVSTPLGPAWIYIMTDQGYKQNSKVESGDWVQRHNKGVINTCG